jgi:hypothetical protein
MRASRCVVVLGVRWLDTAWDFAIDALDPIQSSVKPEHSRTPSFPQNVLGNCGTWARPWCRANDPSDASVGHRPTIWTKQILSANGAIHPHGVFRKMCSITHVGVWWWMGRARVDGTDFQPLPDGRSDTWGIAPGWFEGTPLALAASRATPCSPLRLNQKSP